MAISMERVLVKSQGRTVGAVECIAACDNLQETVEAVGGEAKAIELIIAQDRANRTNKVRADWTKNKDKQDKIRQDVQGHANRLIADGSTEEGVALIQRLAEINGSFDSLLEIHREIWPHASVVA